MNGNWQRVRAAFDRAVDLPHAERAAFLDRELGDDPAARATAERLLSFATTDGFLQPPGGKTLGVPGPVRLLPGQTLGAWVLGELLGEGGMGVVYVAEQPRPRRRVALKVLRTHLDEARARRRFESEVDAMARLQHPCIAQVYEAGVEPDGTCWFAMELLADAAPLSRAAVVREGSLRDRLALFVQVVEAVQHAHQRGVIHRDLKPANVLVLPDGSPKVIDFGIARVLTPGEAGTEGGPLLGTLAYMSPEQVEGREIDLRTDVYSLGAMLYELAAGEKPFAVENLALAAACRAIVEQEPASPTQHGGRGPLELDWIVAAAMRKDPGARYASAAELAADVRRLLGDEPVLAAPPSRRYRLRKFVRRHRLAVASITSIVLVTLAALVLVTTALLDTRRAEQEAQAGRIAAETAAGRAAAALDFLLDVFSSVDPGKDGREVRMADALARAARDVTSRFAEQPLIRASLEHTIGMAYFGLGLFGDAEQHLRASAASFASLEGALPDQAGALVDLSLVQSRRGDLDAAAASLQTAETLASGRPAAEVLPAAVATRRADLLRARGDRLGARAILEPLVARMVAERTAMDRPTLLAANLLAGVLHELGDLEPAERLYRQALERIVAIKGQDHPEALAVLSNLLMVQYSRGERTAMLPTLQQLLATRRRVLGDDHPDTIGALNNVAGVEVGLGRFADAVVHYREAAQRIAAREGEQHPAYAAILSNLATAEREARDYAAALEHADQALALRRQRLGAAHDSTLLVQAMAADVRRLLGKHAAALAMFEECRRLAAEATPPQLANVYRCDLGIGRTATEMRSFEVAEAALLRCRESFAAAEKAAVVKGQLTPPDKDLATLARVSGKQVDATK